ncbi:MAG: VWA domain-containing protein [Bdellovibrionales bacterium]|nr:VWA domain-containing protein [Bdellovibrionales bacterium]
MSGKRRNRKSKAKKAGKTNVKSGALPVEIVVVLDRSGSMASRLEDAKGGFDHLIAEQKKLGGDCRVTLAQFDHEYELVYQSKPIDEVPPLELVPRGTTALLDAVGRTILTTRGSVEKEGGRKVIFVIITDGVENASSEFNGAVIKQLVESQKDWDFMYMGANVDAFAEAGTLGISQNQTFQVGNDPDSMTQMIFTLNDCIASIRAEEPGDKVQMEVLDKEGKVKFKKKGHC